MTINSPPAADDPERIDILQKAERIISTIYSIPVPDILTYQSDLLIKKGDFEAKLIEIQSFLGASHLNLVDLVNAVNALKVNLDTFDLLPLDIADEERQIVVLAEDLNTQATKLHASLSDKSAAVLDLINTADATAEAKEKVSTLTEAARLLLGEDFQMVPEFTLSAEQGTELENAFNNQAQLLDHQTTTMGNDFPVDDWLYGVARVREKLGAWESMIMLAEGFQDRAPLNLTPIQLPFEADAPWLGLQYPETYEIESDKLLYTAYLPSFNPAQVQCGLLVDEWTEVIPAKKETTGLTFHYDQPNTEPPQTMLLMTPSSFTGSWTWEDVVNTLDETMNLAKTAGSRT